MGDRELENYLQQSLRQGTALERERDKKSARLQETIDLCTGIMREQRSAHKSRQEPRTDFVQYLSDIFRFEGISIFGLQALVLCIVCLKLSTIEAVPQYMPVCMPLFVLAVMPVMFRCQYYGMSEIEAVTRASGSQIILAKLVLIGAADLVCMTVLIVLGSHLQDSCREIGRMILYCLVPYLVCMVSMLRLIRLRRKENMQICAAVVFGSCVCWGVLARTMPWLYEASAFGIWIIAFLFFAVFFVKEIYFIVTTRKEGKLYGIIN